MNLGKLLGAGKTFFGAYGMPAYRKNKHVYLPKFNAPKNPFNPKSEEGTSGASQAEQKQFASSPGARPARATNWTTKLNPFRAPAAQRPEGALAVQPELSLGDVKVVQNDLSDADIEIVPMKSHTVSPGELPMLMPEREPWGFAKERLVKNG